MLTESLGGKIKVESVEGMWTKFIFYIEDQQRDDDEEEEFENRKVDSDEFSEFDQPSSLIQNIITAEYRTGVNFNN